MSKVNDEVFDKIVAKLESGVIPWRKPWKGSAPRNAKTNRPYNGINRILLSLTDYEDGRWATFKQLQELGGNVKKGEKGTQVVFWQMFTREKDGKEETIPYAKFYTVFNIAQTEGIEWTTEGKTPECAIDEAELIWTNYDNRPSISFGGEIACYSPVNDAIKMPPKSAFNNTEEYYSTLFHEAIHSTGHQTRLNREGITNPIHFGTETYSLEELIAELGASFLCAESGINNTLDNSAAYIKGWLKALKDHPKALFTAASSAQKAFDWIKGNATTANE